MNYLTIGKYIVSLYEGANISASNVEEKDKTLSENIRSEF
ncbi:hypothetical protein PPIS_a1969 [Pseudoalteromonas piscicida]|uniref:Uncharacterized protein n=1 Tax=Pseudoalteromonas piscicida TaxID=43662 RepID=A0ABN5CBR9_PSEO7|nr:hypothetical protein PPIS_a1967 [Pseudoalteromonas piscicida]ATD07022.1 hypothetical protein PPIS_a1969 [Pseudoalteromonas piscicida]